MRRDWPLPPIKPCSKEDSHAADDGTRLRRPFPGRRCHVRPAGDADEKLQALEAYAKSAKDVSGREHDLYQQLIQEDTRHAEQVYEVLRARIGR